MLATLAAFATVQGQSLVYAPTQGESFRYQTRNQLTVTQQILESENHYTLRADGVVRLTLMNPGPRLLWRLGYEELNLRIEGAFPSPRAEGLRGTVVTLATTPQGVVLDALASGVVSPGIGGQYVERAAAAFLPRLPEGSASPGAVWTDTLLFTEVLQGVTAEVTTVLRYTIADTSAIAGRAVVPVEYTGTISVTGSGLIEGSRVEVDGSGRVRGHYLFDPADRVFDLHEQEQVLESTLTLMSPDQRTVGIPSRQVLNARSERLF
ncbi:MAG TPA: hypothetical protein VEY33_15095 [Gemmatimonadota bacterium]|nr:hypothetical protein [Gemmatimonadota bacterium]